MNKIMLKEFSFQVRIYGIIAFIKEVKVDYYFTYDLPNMYKYIKFSNKFTS